MHANEHVRESGERRGPSACLVAEAPPPPQV